MPVNKAPPGGEQLGGDIFEQFGVPRVVNCCGVYTDLGGSVLSPRLWRAAETLNEAYVRLPELIDRSSALIARLVQAEAARITPGCSAALTLAVGATMTRSTGAHWEQLPDTSGLKSEVVIAASHLANYKYAVCARMSGAQLKAAGPRDSYSLDALIDAISPRTASLLVPAHLLDGFEGVDQLEKLVDAAHQRHVPVVVDAAYMCYPVHLLPLYARSGADLTCFSAKYFGGPNSGGFVSGSAELIGAVAGLDFTRFESGEYRSFGRAFKMSRYDVALTALALQDWMAADHEERWASYARMVDVIARALPAVRNVRAERRLFTMCEELLCGDSINCLVLTFGPDVLRTAADIAAHLAAGDPSIEAIVEGDSLIIAVDALIEGQDAIVGTALAEALQSGTSNALPGLRY